MTQGIAAPSIKPRARSEPAPLSFAQERLWFLEQLEPESSVYNICRAYRLLGNLNTSALEASLNEIISRHETLRTAFRLVDGRPVQVVQPIQNISIEYVDLRAIPDNERDAEIQRRIKADLHCAFDLSAGFLLRSTLLRAGDQEHVLILMTHHAAFDAWSMGILTRELWTLYQAFSNGNPSQLEPLPVQYSDYAVWQRDWLQGEVLKAQLLYWKEHLKNLPILNLPTDQPRKARQSFHGARVTITLPEELTRALNEMSHRHGVTPFMTLLAGFQVLLYRYTGQEDVVVGSPVANRRRPELEGLIGFFVNSLVLRGDLSGNPSFRNLLLRTRDLCIAAGTNQDLPFEKLVQELQPERDQSRNPLFQVMFVLQNATRPFTGIPSLRIEPMEVTTTRSPFDLSLFLRERAGKYIGHIEYSTDLFNRDRIDRMASHFQTLLGAIVADPDQPIATLPILTEAERRQMLIEWNDTGADYPKNKCIHQLFEEQVERTPEAIAVKFEDQQITYRELNQRANQLAHQLMTLGIGPEKLVGVCIERSIEMVVGLLGILKAGGAYVPLDPAYPDVRLRFMVEDSQAFVLLTTEATIESRRSRMENGHSLFATLDPRLQIVSLDRDSVTASQRNDKIAKSEVKSSNLAYIIYTSGSTGQPKGVAIEHRNAVNLLHWAKTVYGKNELAGVFASTSICFDLSVFELFVPMTCGGKVILAWNALSLHDLAAKQEITLINTVPSVMTQLLKLSPLPETVRVVNLAGERLKLELVENLYKQASVEKVYDLYGPSETTTYSTFALRTTEGPTTIGRPVANTCVFILDSRLQPVPVGVEGELYIGGDGLARGYLNRPEMTSEQFVRPPFNELCAKRLYRTGDQARYQADGNIEFLGRTDNQVKIRGYRIEPGEIEAVLNQHPTIKESVVLAREPDLNLIGYFVPKAASPIISELRNFLREKLPDYMVPPLLVELEILPLLPNGKIDRIALQSPDNMGPELKEAYVEARTQVEELLAQIWGEILMVRAMSIHDNFFELGGHSLLAIQIISRVREAFQKDVPLSALFDAPTVAGLAATIEKTISAGFDELPLIVRVPRGGPFPLSINQEYLWRLERIIPGTHFFNMPYVYRLSGNLNVAALEQALKDIIRRHEALRTVFICNEEKPLQIVNPLGNFYLPVVDLRVLTSEGKRDEAARLIVDERHQGFDLGKGPLLRTKLIQLTPTESLLLLTLHHIISDHFSVLRIREELLNLYAALCRKEKAPLPEPQIQFADFAVWERKLLDEGLLDYQMSYWKEQLSGRSTEVLLKKPRPHANFYFSRELITFDEDLFRKMRTFAYAQAYTPFIIMVAALSVLIHFHTGQGEIRIGTLVANRSRRDTDDLIGNLTNTVILKLQISSDTTLDALMTDTRTVTLLAFAHEQIPFEYLAQTLGSEQKSRGGLLFETLLIYQRSSAQQTETHGLKFAALEISQERVEAEVVMSTSPLIFRLHESSTTLTGTVNYKSASFSSADMVSMKKALDAILKNMVGANIKRLSVGNLVSFLKSFQ